MEPVPPLPDGSAARTGDKARRTWPFGPAEGTARPAAALEERLLIAWTRSRDRLESVQSTLSRSTELVAHSQDALARSGKLLEPEARRAGSLPGMLPPRQE